MALIECFECKKQISGQAKTCPHCGVSLKRFHPTRVILLVLFCLFLICLLSSADMREYLGMSRGDSEENGYTEKKLMQLEVESWLNDQEEIKELGLKCLSVGLVKESENKYIGLAKFDNGEETHVEVTTDGDQYLMNAKFPLGIPNKEKEHEFQEGFRKLPPRLEN